MLPCRSSLPKARDSGRSTRMACLNRNSTVCTRFVIEGRRSTPPRGATIKAIDPLLERTTLKHTANSTSLAWTPCSILVGSKSGPGDCKPRHRRVTEAIARVLGNMLSQAASAQCPSLEDVEGGKGFGARSGTTVAPRRHASQTKTSQKPMPLVAIETRCHLALIRFLCGFYTDSLYSPPLHLLPNNPHPTHRPPRPLSSNGFGLAAPLFLSPSRLKTPVPACRPPARAPPICPSPWRLKRHDSSHGLSQLVSSCRGYNVNFSVAEPLLLSHALLAEPPMPWHASFTLASGGVLSPYTLRV